MVCMVYKMTEKLADYEAFESTNARDMDLISETKTKQRKSLKAH